MLSVRWRRWAPPRTTSRRYRPEWGLYLTHSTPGDHTLVRPPGHWLRPHLSAASCAVSKIAATSIDAPGSGVATTTVSMTSAASIDALTTVSASSPVSIVGVASPELSAPPPPPPLHRRSLFCGFEDRRNLDRRPGKRRGHLRRLDDQRGLDRRPGHRPGLFPGFDRRRGLPGAFRSSSAAASFATASAPTR